MGLGWNRLQLRVDLTTGHIASGPISEQLLCQYLGGEGLAARVLYDETVEGTDPFAPECPLIFAVGPFTGTAIGGGRMSLVTRSCVTGLMVSGSIGGHFGPALKYAGFDLLVVTGLSPKPVLLHIDDRKATLRDATYLWGLDVWEAADVLCANCGSDYQTLCIGPAGEHVVVSATAMANRNHSGGRYGFAAAMGAKRLKAVVARGTGPVKLADPARFASAQDAIWRLTDPATDANASMMSIYGSTGGIRRLHSVGALPTRNFTAGEFEHVLDCSADTYLRNHFDKGKACFGCRFPSCMHWTSVKEGQYKGLAYEGPQAGTIEGLGTLLGIGDPVAQIRAHILCNRLGICMLGIGSLIGWAMEAYERGALTTKDTDGLELRWGSSEVVLELTRRVAFREGRFADLLADGLAKAAATVGRGTEAYALTIKGQEMSPVAPTAFLNMGLAYAINDRGPIHTHHARLAPPAAASVPPDIRAALPFDLAKAADRTLPANKGHYVKWVADSRVVMNSLVYCHILNVGRLSVDLHPIAEALSAATGVEFTHSSLMEIGERVSNLARAYAVRMGRTRRDDTLPKRFLEEGFPTGGSLGLVVPLEQMLDDYYLAREWDGESGIPLADTMERLGLSSESRDLQAVRDLEAARIDRDREFEERAARRAEQNALHAQRITASAARAQQAMLAISSPKHVQVRYLGPICVATGGIQADEILTSANTVLELLIELGTRYPDVAKAMLDAPRSSLAPCRAILALVPGGIAGPVSLTASLVDQMVVTLC